MSYYWLIGASEGIGRALVKCLDARGYSLVLSARNKERLKELKSELHNPRHLIFPTDVANPSEGQGQKAFLNDIELEGVIYCAGHYAPMSSLNINFEECLKTLAVNLTGAMGVLAITIPRFVKQNKGHIVLIGSVAGYRGLPNAFGYGASKAGLIHLGENLKADLLKTNIKIQVINPGFVKTRLTDKNHFKMPGLISAEEAAEHIAEIMVGPKFISHFPGWFGRFMAFLKYLPQSIYFWLVSKIDGS